MEDISHAQDDPVEGGLILALSNHFGVVCGLFAAGKFTLE
jgi:hypothetical protein